METITKRTKSGEDVNYRMTKEKGFFTSHLWVYKNEKPYLHIMPNESGRGKIFKYCEGFGYLAMCEIMKEFNNITLNDLIGL